jgi:hypothetical protein
VIESISVEDGRAPAERAEQSGDCWQRGALQADWGASQTHPMMGSCFEQERIHGIEPRNRHRAKLLVRKCRVIFCCCAMVNLEGVEAKDAKYKPFRRRLLVDLRL